MPSYDYYLITSNRYQLIGEEERACGNDKKWSFAPPECKCVACPILSLDNGRIETADENKVSPRFLNHNFNLSMMKHD